MAYESTTKLKFLASDIFQFFHAVDTPPADEIHVPLEYLRVHKNGYYTATVRFVVTYGGMRKVHSIRIGFTTDTYGRFDNTSWNYLT